MTTSIRSLYAHGNPADIHLGNLERWLKEGKLSKEALLEADEEERPWLVKWLARKISLTRSQLMKGYETPQELARLATALIDHAQAWDLLWMDNSGMIAPSDASGNHRPSKIVDLLLWRSSDDMFQEWLKTAALDHLKPLIGMRLYADGRHGTPKTALHMAVAKDRTEIMKWMIDNGADIQARSPNGQTPVFDARSVRTLQYLMKKGATLADKDNDGLLPAEVWLSKPEIRADLMIGPFLKTHPAAFPPSVVLKAVVAHTAANLAFGSDNKPSALYRQAKEQIHVPFELNGQSQTLLSLWADHALQRKEPERLQWALRLKPKETVIAPGVTDGDLARLAWTMKNAATFYSDKEVQTWEQLERTYAAALERPLNEKTALLAFPTTLLGTLLRQSPALIDQRLAGLGMPEGPTSRLSRAMTWVAQNQGCTQAGHYYSVEKSSLMNFLTQHAPPADTLAPALLLLSRDTGRARELEEGHPLMKADWVSPATLVLQPDQWNDQLLLAAWCQHALMACQSQGTLSPEEWDALTQCNARMQEAGSNLAWVTSRWESMAKQRFLNDQLPAPAKPAERLRF